MTPAMEIEVEAEANQRKKIRKETKRIRESTLPTKRKTSI